MQIADVNGHADFTESDSIEANRGTNEKRKSVRKRHRDGEAQ